MASSELVKTTIPIQMLELPEGISKRDKAFAVLRANGFNIKDSYEIAGKKTGCSDSAPSHQEKKVRSLSIINPELIKSAHQAVKDTLEMKSQPVTRTMVTKNGEAVTYNDNLYPSHSNRLEAARMVIDRDEPTIQKQVRMNLNAEVSAELIDLKAYRDIPNNDNDVMDAEYSDVTDMNVSQKDSEPLINKDNVLDTLSSIK